MCRKEVQAFKAAVKKVVEERLIDSPQRPSVDELVSYQLGELSQRQTDEISEYLALNPEMAEQLLETQGEIDARCLEDISGLTDNQVGSDFRKVMQRVAVPESGPAAAEHWWDGLVTRWRPVYLLLPTAVLTACFSFWLGFEYAGSIPRRNISVHELLSKRDAATRGGNPTFSITPGTEHVLIALSLSEKEKQSFSVYTADMVNPDGSLERRIDEIRRDSGVLSFQLASGQLRSHEYTIVLYGIEGTRETKLAEFELKVKREP